MNSLELNKRFEYRDTDMYQAEVFYNDEVTDVEGFCDKLMEDIIRVIDTLHKIELRYKAVRMNGAISTWIGIAGF